MQGLAVSSPGRLVLGSIFVIWYVYRFAKKRHLGVETPFFSLFSQESSLGFPTYITYIVDALILISFFFLLAGPSVSHRGHSSKTGIDIVFVLDISRSMLADDFSPNRLEVAKSGIRSFIEQRRDDRVGLVVFSGKPFVSLPLTFDYAFVGETIQAITTDTINQEVEALQGTATGEGLLRAVDMIETAQGDESAGERAQIIVLLTDGKVTPGTLDPLLVSKLAAREHIDIYTLGIGSEAGGSFVYTGGLLDRRIQVPGVDDEMLQQIAKITDANYRRVTDEAVFGEVFNEISQITKAELRLGVSQERISLEKYLSMVLVLLLFLRGLWICLFELPLVSSDIT